MNLFYSVDAEGLDLGWSSSKLYSLQLFALLLCSSRINDMGTLICQKHPQQLRGNLSTEDFVLCELSFASFKQVPQILEPTL